MLAFILTRRWATGQWEWRVLVATQQWWCACCSFPPLRSVLHTQCKYKSSCLIALISLLHCVRPVQCIQWAEYNLEITSDYWRLFAEFFFRDRALILLLASRQKSHEGQVSLAEQSISKTSWVSLSLSSIDVNVSFSTRMMWMFSISPAKWTYSIYLEWRCLCRYGLANPELMRRARHLLMWEAFSEPVSRCFWRAPEVILTSLRPRRPVLATSVSQTQEDI